MPVVDEPRSAIKRWLLGPGGFTLPELLITMVFAMTVLGTLYSFYRTQLHGFRSREKGIEILEEAREAMDLMVREIRNGGFWGAGTQPGGCNRVSAASATAINIQADSRGGSVGSDPDGDCDDDNESINFAYDSATKKITRNNQKIAENVEVSASTLFQYYRIGEAAAFSPSTQADRDTIKRVRISFTIQVPNPDPTVGGNLSTTLTSDTTLRN